MNTLVRQLNFDDAREFKAIRLDSLKNDPDSWLATYDEEKDLSPLSFSNKLQYAISTPIFGFYGYFENGKLLGYAQVSSGYWFKKRHIVTLYDVCVSNNARKKGIGTKILKNIIEKAKTFKEVEQIQLRVNSRNKAAMSLYKSLGFKLTATFPQSVKEKDGSYQDEYLLTLNI